MKEALKLALEALERYQVKRQDFDTFEEAITAIKAALAQPAQEPDNGDELTIAYMSGVHRGKELAAQPAQEPWCMKMNGCKTKCADCPDEPAQREPLIAFRHGCKWCGELNGCEHKQPAQEPDYAYPTIEGYEEITGFKVNDTFRMGWVMARTTNDLFKQMEKKNG